MPLFALVAAFLLLVAPSALAQTPQPGWISDARTGCKVWDPSPVPNESVTWSGACQNGVGQGWGVEQWFQDGKPGNRLEGEQGDGKMNGRVVVTYPNGDRYEGELGDGNRNGQGVYTSANGARYEGAYRDGKPNGRGVRTYPNGDRYEGEFHDGGPNGQGVYASVNGDRREGLWRDGNFIEGTGSATTPASPDRRSPVSSHRDEIRLIKEDGGLVVPVRINNAITLNFMIDSGSTDVSIPTDVVMTLFRTKTLKESDFLGKQIYRLADGSTVPSQTFRIRILRVGDREIENVTGSIAGVEGALLLGQSFLSRFKSWSIDNQRQMLVLE